MVLALRTLLHEIKCIRGNVQLGKAGELEAEKIVNCSVLFKKEKNSAGLTIF